MSISEIYKLFISSSGISIDSRLIVKNNLFLGQNYHYNYYFFHNSLEEEKG